MCFVSIILYPYVFLSRSLADFVGDGDDDGDDDGAVVVAGKGKGGGGAPAWVDDDDANIKVLSGRVTIKLPYFHLSNTRVNLTRCCRCYSSSHSRYRARAHVDPA